MKSYEYVWILSGVCDGDNRYQCTSWIVSCHKTRDKVGQIKEQLEEICKKHGLIATKGSYLPTFTGDTGQRQAAYWEIKPIDPQSAEYQHGDRSNTLSDKVSWLVTKHELLPE